MTKPNQVLTSASRVFFQLIRGGTQSDQQKAHGGGKEGGARLPKQPGKIINKNEAPINFRENCVGEPEQEGRHMAPVKLGTGHAISADRINPPFVPKLGNLVAPLLEQHFDASMSLGDVSFEKNPFLSRVRKAPGPAGADAGIPGSKSPAFTTAICLAVVLNWHWCT